MCGADVLFIAPAKYTAFTALDIRKECLYLPIANAYLGMLFTGNRGIKINMALSTQYVCPAFEDVDIQLRISLHRLSLIASQEPAIGMLPGPESIWRTC